MTHPKDTAGHGEAPEGAGWRVKALLWDVDGDTYVKPAFVAKDPWGDGYRVWRAPDGIWHVEHDHLILTADCEQPSEEAAKAVAQQDFAARIRACIEPAPPDARDRRIAEAAGGLMAALDKGKAAEAALYAKQIAREYQSQSAAYAALDAAKEAVETAVEALRAVRADAPPAGWACTGRTQPRGAER